MKHLRSSTLALEQGFTLLEVIIAMAIMVVAFSSILAVEGSSINASARAKQMNVVAMLAKNQMIEAEYKIEGKKFEEVKKEESGTFEPPFQDYRWKTVVKEITLPQISPSGGKSTGQTGENQNTEMVTKLVTKFLTKAIREVKVSILWTKGTAEQDFSLSTYWVDLNYEFSLSE